MIESTLTSKGQTTLPKEVREALGLKPGDKLRYFVHGDTVRIVRPKPASALFGMLKKHYEGPPVSLEEMDEAIADEAAARFRRAVER
ncbi:AbrB/MazE/SpoVT family DNA-binding domain-containing protein [Roseitranquillus sediminis]|uniref:AbrB/MazE/SpoVT family DNA-binding domain-containing protein n=1 Tax=Roseitranquillus sediminis TaxID=2809051 RepID=UPI001D0CCE7E|nr:AbrB/MazE/SpoVT family DNA-binding domain-containing protein [Roseitranquillus sediminis]MBM9593903.1 AbrB/MazE/SpoVT family DNA-binding domain-containing protein [Roseitranquillus sediminis]